MTMDGQEEKQGERQKIRHCEMVGMVQVIVVAPFPQVRKAR